MAAAACRTRQNRDTMARRRAPEINYRTAIALDRQRLKVHSLARRFEPMLVSYGLTERGPEPLTAGGIAVPPGTAWVDLYQPSQIEDRAAEAFLGASLPTREETQEIEFSSRFYSEDGAVFMTATLLTGIESHNPMLTPFTIVVAGDRIATLRYEELRAFKQFLARAAKTGSVAATAPAIFLGMIEAIVDRTADVLERISGDVDRINHEVFAQGKDTRPKGRALEVLIDNIGVQGDLAAKARESLASLERLAQYAGVALPSTFAKGSHRARLKLIARDVRSLEDHVTFVSNKVTFLLDATLGLISTQQNEVIRILTVATTVFFPPTLIGTIYGMNFRIIPELNWSFGYPVALVLMIASAVIPYLYFRRRGWL
jgi:magnesium transporter